MTPVKKLYLILVIAIALFSLLLFKQAREALGLIINPYSQPLISSQAVAIPIDAKDEQYGNPGAALVIVEFADLGCSSCQKTHYLLTKFVNAHPREARLVWKDAPSAAGFFSAGSYEAHYAAYCAGRQGKFWPFAEISMQSRVNLRAAGLKKTAEGLGLEMNRWQTCLNADETKQKISDSVALAAKLGLTGFPAVFVDNQKLDTTAGVDLEEMLTKILNKK